MKPFPENPNYLVDEQGNVLSIQMPDKTGKRKRITPRPIKRFIRNRYWTVALASMGTLKKRKISYLVLRTFIGPRPKGFVIRHGANGIHDDSLSNLSWGTPQDNEKDKIRDGTLYRGEKVGTAKLNELQVRIIRRAYSKNGIDGISGKQLARIFDINEKNIHQIIKGELWAHVKHP